MKMKMILLFVAAAILSLGGCAAITPKEWADYGDLTIHNRGWSKITDPAEGVLKLSTTRDFWGYPGAGSLAQVAAGYNMRTCVYSPEVALFSDGRTTFSVPAPRGMGSRVMDAMLNRLEPCMHLQGFYNDLASGVGGYCTADGQPTQKFIDTAENFLKSHPNLHGNLSVFNLAQFGKGKTQFSIPLQDSSPTGFAKTACAEAVMSARAGGFWNKGCPVYQSEPLPISDAAAMAVLQKNKRDYSCRYAEATALAGVRLNGAWMTYGPIVSTNYESSTYTSLNPLTLWLLGKGNGFSLNPQAQYQPAMQYLQKIWSQVEQAHPYIGGVQPPIPGLTDVFESEMSEAKAADACFWVQQQNGKNPPGVGEYNYPGGTYKCMMDQGWRKYSWENQK